MTRLLSALRTRIALAALMLVALIVAPALAMTADERSKLDLSNYRVTNTEAAWFDVVARRAELAETTDHLLLRQLADLRKVDVCPASQQLPLVSGSVVIPRFYEDRDGWRQASAPFLAFEDTVSKLAAQQFVAPESGAGRCLLDVLDRFAAAEVYLDVDAKTSGLQTWFQTESSLFAAALAYSAVRGEVDGDAARKQRIEDWLVAAARNHLRYAGGKDGTCCNNHFYRRALYAVTIGALTGTDDLFQIGISAIYSALADSAPNGALRLEMLREQNAARYQVYAAMHLAMIAQVAAQQGYDLYALEVEGRSLKPIIDFAIAVLLAPESAADAAGTPKQDTSFLSGREYFGWLELLAGRPEWRDATQALLAAHRPTYLRSLGGYLTLYLLPTASAR